VIPLLVVEDDYIVSLPSGKFSALLYAVWLRRSKLVPWSRHAPGFCMYALRVLRAHGLPQQSLNYVDRTVVQWKFLYAASAWFGFCTAGIKWGSTRFFAYVGSLDILAATWRLKTCDDADEQLFNRLINNLNHIFHSIDCYHHPPQCHNDTSLEATGTHTPATGAPH